MKRIVIFEIEGTEFECETAVDDLKRAAEQLEPFSIRERKTYIGTDLILLDGRSMRS